MLEVSVVAGWLEAESLDLGGDVVGALVVVHRAGEAAHHGIVGELVDPRHEVERRDGADGRRADELEREGRGDVGVRLGATQGHGALDVLRLRGDGGREREAGDEEREKHALMAVRGIRFRWESSMELNRRTERCD